MKSNMPKTVYAFCIKRGTGPTSKGPVLCKRSTASNCWVPVSWNVNYFFVYRLGLDCSSVYQDDVVFASINRREVEAFIKGYDVLYKDIQSKLRNVLLPR